MSTGAQSKTGGARRVHRFAAAAAAPALWLALAPTVAAALDAPKVSWGKADVSYEQYRADALDCGKNGLATDIDNSDPVNTLRTAAMQLQALDDHWTNINVNRAELPADAYERQQIETAARPKEQFAKIKAMMFVAVRKCMSDHGYARFTLTDAQRAEMNKIGDLNGRRQYLFKLASNREVLEKQKLTVTP